MGAFEARKDSWSFYTDMAYLRLAADRSETRVFSVNPQVGGTLSASASASFKMFIGEFGAAYEIFRTGAPGSATAIDLYGGGRVWWQQAEASLALRAGLTIGDLEISRGRAFARGGDVSWVDPFVGARLRHRFSPSTELVVKGDVGEFGVGSTFSWQAAGTFNWDFAQDGARPLDRGHWLSRPPGRLLPGGRRNPLRIRHVDAWPGVRRDRPILTYSPPDRFVLGLLDEFTPPSGLFGDVRARRPFHRDQRHSVDLQLQPVQLLLALHRHRRRKGNHQPLERVAIGFDALMQRILHPADRELVLGDPLQRIRPSASPRSLT